MFTVSIESFKKTVAMSDLPSSWADRVTLLPEVGDVLDQPLVDLGQGQPLVRRTLDGLGDQVGVGQVAPRVASGKVNKVRSSPHRLVAGLVPPFYNIKIWLVAINRHCSCFEDPARIMQDIFCLFYISQALNDLKLTQSLLSDRVGDIMVNYDCCNRGSKPGINLVKKLGGQINH